MPVRSQRRRSLAGLGLVLLCVLVAAGIAVAKKAPSGSLEHSFTSFPGRATTDFSGTDERAFGVAVQKDGKIVAAGYSTPGSYQDFAVVRYLADGSLDTGLGGDWKTTTSFGANDAIAYDVALQDGKIVAAGTNFVTHEDFALARYNDDATLDTDFGCAAPPCSGKVTTDFGSFDSGLAVAVQKDGKIVVAGFTGPVSSEDFAVARYNANGTLDPTFDGDGKVTTDFGSGDDRAYAVAIQKDGRIVVAGSSWDGVIREFAVARYNTDGSLDAGFGFGGMVRVPVGPGDAEAYAVVIQKNKKIVLGGMAESTHSDFGLARFDEGGSLDPTFGSGGTVTTDMSPTGFDDSIRALLAQKHGKIVAAGSAATDSLTHQDFALARYDKNGALDPSFDSDGKVLTDFFGGFDWGNALAATRKGSIVLAGGAANGTDDDFGLAEYRP